MKEMTSFLQRLGLTEYEAKVLHSLLALNEAEAPAIGRHAQVPKTRVYDVLERLVARNLIVETYGRPKRYKVIDPKHVFSSLLEERRKELQELEGKSASLLQHLSAPPSLASENVMKVKDLGDFYRILAQEIGSAKDSVIAFSHVSKSHSSLKDAVKTAAQNKVQVRMLDAFSSQSVLKELEDHAELRPLNHGLHAYVIDNKKVVLALTDTAKESPDYHFTVWQDNKPMARALTSYFDSCWNKK